MRYTLPKIKTYPLTKPDGSKGKNWYVWFRINGENPKRFSLGINEHTTYEGRLEAAIVLREALIRKLESGWVPDAPEKREKTYTLIEALDFSLEKLKGRLATKSYLDYKGAVNFFKTSAKALKYDKRNIKNIERYHVKTTLDHIKEKRKWSNHAYNKATRYIKSVFSEMLEYDLIKINPAHGIRSLHYKSPPREFPTDEEQRKIIEHLYKRHFTFLRFIKVLYQTGIRPKELLGIQIKDVDLDRRLILVTSSNSKTNTQRLVPIKTDILPELSYMMLDTQPDWYLFGRPRKKGGVYGKTNSYCPSPHRTKRDTATGHWKKYVKEELGIEKDMYSMKHKAANDMMFDGVSLDAIKTMYGHSDSKITEIYANQISKIRFEEVRRKERKFE